VSRAIASPSPDTATHILNVAERLAQARGFNGFSYADIAAEVRITKASLHYHFPTKAELGRSLIVRYAASFASALQRIAPGAVAAALAHYVELYEQLLVRDLMCLCGMFAAEYSTLPVAMQKELRRFFDMNEQWLVEQLKRGRQSGELQLTASPLESARTLTAGLEGAMLLARSYEDPARFAAIARQLLGQLGVHSPQGARRPRPMGTRQQARGARLP
jgi:TetR/AcrR family transcriptional regulator, transcriptional repressor for nem operon